MSSDINNKRLAIIIDNYNHMGNPDHLIVNKQRYHVGELEEVLKCVNFKVNILSNKSLDEIQTWIRDIDTYEIECVMVFNITLSTSNTKYLDGLGREYNPSNISDKINQKFLRIPKIYFTQGIYYDVPGGKDETDGSQTDSMDKAGELKMDPNKFIFSAYSRSNDGDQYNWYLRHLWDVFYTRGKVDPFKKLVDMIHDRQGDNFYIYEFSNELETLRFY